MYSFIGSGCICPEPEAEVATVTCSGLRRYPASVISLRAVSGSYLIWKVGLPCHGLSARRRRSLRSYSRRDSFQLGAVQDTGWRLCARGYLSTASLLKGELPRPQVRLGVGVDFKTLDLI
jgi:hypothetical protein